MHDFTLDPRLEKDSTFVIALELCDVRLHHNAAFPWIFLVPRREGICEIIELTPSDQHLLMEEIGVASQVMRHLFQPTKLNIANLGNIVPQLHIHIVARYDYDQAWPNPIWNSGINLSYDSKSKIERIAHLKDEFCTFKSHLMTKGA